MLLYRFGACGMVLTALAGCAHEISPTLNQGPAAIAVTGVADPAATPGPYRLGPSDILDVNVLYEPDLTLSQTTVDTNGEISVPMIGAVQASGKTAPELAAEIQSRLTRYVRAPQVVVNVTRFARQIVTVEGDVEEPGVFDVPGTASLLQALALAQGPTRVAKLDEVIIFRTVNGQRTGAVFDVRRIRRGFDEDPMILGGDVVVVGYSEVKGAFRDFLAGAPALAIFRSY